MPDCPSMAPTMADAITAASPKPRGFPSSGEAAPEPAREEDSSECISSRLPPTPVRRLRIDDAWSLRDNSGTAASTPAGFASEENKAIISSAAIGRTAVPAVAVV